MGLYQGGSPPNLVYPHHAMDPPLAAVNGKHESPVGAHPAMGVGDAGTTRAALVGVEWVHRVRGM